MITAGMIIYPENLFQKTGFDAIKETAGEYCRSEMGLEEMELVKPVSNHKIIERELSLTREMMALQSSGDSIPFDHSHDIRKAAKRSRVERAILDAPSMLKIRQFCATCRVLKAFIRAREERLPNLCILTTEITPLKELENDIERIINEHGSVRDDASAALQQIRKSLNSRRNQLRLALDKIIRRATKDGYMSEPEPTIRNGRLVLPVKAEHKRKINGFIQDVSATGQTVYLEPAEALHINNDIRELEQQEYREVERLLMQLTATIGQHHQMLLLNSTVMGKMDMIMARATFCHSLDAIIPEMNVNGFIRLKNARNPILLLKNKTRPKEVREKVVPLNLSLEPEERGLIITGPNAGGKSVTLKTAGICQVMMQSGFGICADDDTSLPVFSGIFLDMGDEQSIDDDLSTFSSRLTWIRETMSAAEPDSLVLVDEAGTGTDPEEGVALYQAFLEVMIQRGCTVIATTHHGNLKVFAHNHQYVVNASMEFDQENLSPTYSFRKGVPGSSYAFEIGQRIGVSEALLKRARELVGSSKNRLESLIIDMETKSQQAEQLRMELAMEKAKAGKLIQEYEQRLTSIKTERNKLREKALTEAKEIMNNANARVEQAVQRILESKGDKEAIRIIRDEIEQQKEAVEHQLEETTAERKNKQKTYKEPPVKGDTVNLLDSNTTGELLEINGKNAVVLVNGLRLKTKFRNLIKTDKPKEKKYGYKLLQADDNGSDVQPVKQSLDIRGFRGEEAIRELTHFLDRARTARLQSVEIIHGKGDGILKKLVHEELTRRADISSFELAPWEQGGPGCTVAKIR